MNHIRQTGLLIKRILCKPLMLLILLSIPVCVTVVKLLPDELQSTEIVSGIYIESPDEHTDEFLEELTKSSTGFTFTEYTSDSGLLEAVANGEADSGYVIPDGFSESFPDGIGRLRIAVYVSPSTEFAEVTSESVYAALLRSYAPDIAVHMLSDTSVSDYISSRYNNYLDGDVFAIHTDADGTYVPVTYVSPNNFPVRLLVYIIVFVCGLLGLRNYLCDLDNGVYSILGRRGRSSFCIKNIAAGIIPAAISGIISLLIYEDGTHILRTTLEMLAAAAVYGCICCLIRPVFRSCKAYTIALPCLVICTILLSSLFRLSQM